MVRSIEWDLRPGALIGGACGLLVVPLRWLIAVFCAAMIHEAGHILVLRLQNREIRRIEIRLSGMAIHTQPLEPLEELVCALAGPAGSLLLLFAAPFYPELAVCGMFQGIWNLLPLYPLDGGRAVCSLLGLICPEKAELITKIISGLFVLLMTVFFVAAAVHVRYLWIAFAFAVFRLAGRKFSCNRSCLAVQ